MPRIFLQHWVLELDSCKVYLVAMKLIGMAMKGGITKRYLANLALNPSTCEKTTMSDAAMAEPTEVEFKSSFTQIFLLTNND